MRCAVAASCVLHPVVPAARLERREEDETESTRANEKECSPIIVVVVVAFLSSFLWKVVVVTTQTHKEELWSFSFPIKVACLFLQTTSCYPKHHVFLDLWILIKRIFGYFASHPREKKAQLSRARDARVVVAVVVVVDDDDDDWTTTTTTRSATSTGIRTRASVVQHRRRQPKGRTTDYASSHQCHSSPERRNFLGDASMR